MKSDHDIKQNPDGSYTISIPVKSPLSYTTGRIEFALGKPCECGAHKATGAKFRAPGHSSWCPWAVK